MPVGIHIPKTCLSCEWRVNCPFVAMESKCALVKADKFFNASDIPCLIIIALCVIGLLLPVMGVRI